MLDNTEETIKKDNIMLDNTEGAIKKGQEFARQKKNKVMEYLNMNYGIGRYILY
jgi:hypothetical protein